MFLYEARRFTWIAFYLFASLDDKDVNVVLIPRSSRFSWLTWRSAEMHQDGSLMMMLAIR